MVLMRVMIEYVDRDWQWHDLLVQTLEAKHRASSKAGPVVQLQTGAWHTHKQRTAYAIDQVHI